MRVAILQSHIPHYRRPFFKRLSETGNHQYEVIHGDIRDPGRSGVPTEPLPCSVNITNILLRFGSHAMLIQPEAVMRVLLGRYDVVVVGSVLAIPTNLVSIMGAKAVGCKTLMWSNLWHSDRGLWGNLQFFIERHLIRLFDGFIAYSEGVKKTWMQWGIPPDKIFVAPNTVDIEPIRKDIREIERKAGTLKNQLCPHGEKLLVFVGKIEPEKRVMDAVSAFQEISKERGDVRMVIVGGGKFLPELKFFIEKEGISGIYCVGKIPPGDELFYMKAGDCLLFPGHIGLAIFQALALGCVCIASDNQSAEAEILTDENCIRFPQGNISLLKEAIIRTFEDQGLAESLSANAIRSVEEKASLDKMVKGFESAIDWVVRWRK